MAHILVRPERSEAKSKDADVPSCAIYYVFGHGEATMSGTTGQTGRFPETMAGRSRSATAATPSPREWLDTGRPMT